MSATEEVIAAADALVAAFGRHDKEAYFAAFSADAVFCFYNVPQRLSSRLEYQQLWDAWEREDGFRVLSCASTDRHVQMLGEVAVFTHRVSTATEAQGSASTLDERETIVFAKPGDGGWLAVHEHLSPMPGTATGG